MLQSEKPMSLGWLLFSTNIMNMDLLRGTIVADRIHNLPVGLRWKMINLGMQGKVKLEDQIHTLHVYIDKMDMDIMEPYSSRPTDDHGFPFGIHMQLVLEIDMVLNQKGWKNMEKLHTSCQNSWIKVKLVYIKASEIELLVNHNNILDMSLHNAMMTL